jgi:capsular polysaccharide transport system ATP-binding protein
MIELRNISKAYGSGAARRVVCEGLSAAFDGTTDVGILGANGSGKSTLLRMMAGMEMPDRGQVVRRARISFPIGYSGAFHPNLSARDNVRFVARLYGADIAAVTRFVRDFAEIGQHFDEPLHTYSNTMRARVTFATSIAIEFDLYLVDEVTSVGDVGFKRKCLAALNERRRHARLVMASQSAANVGRFCRTGAIFDCGRLYLFTTMAEAIDMYQNSIAVTDA